MGACSLGALHLSCRGTPLPNAHAPDLALWLLVIESKYTRTYKYMICEKELNSFGAVRLHSCLQHQLDYSSDFFS